MVDETPPPPDQMLLTVGDIEYIDAQVAEADADAARAEAAANRADATAAAMADALGSVGLVPDPEAPQDYYILDTLTDFIPDPEFPDDYYILAGS